MLCHCVLSQGDVILYMLRVRVWEGKLVHPTYCFQQFSLSALSSCLQRCCPFCLPRASFQDEWEGWRGGGWLLRSAPERFQSKPSSRSVPCASGRRGAVATCRFVGERAEPRYAKIKRRQERSYTCENCDVMAVTAPHATRTLALNGLTITATLSRNAVTLARKCRESCNPASPTPGKWQPPH
jgi:hypothetical protein